MNLFLINELFSVFFGFAWGLCFGSFATALMWRIPKGQPWMGRARSVCPSCQTTLSFYDLIPLVSWLSTRGRCRYCQAHISGLYPLTELFWGGIFSLYFGLLGLSVLSILGAFGLFFTIMLMWLGARFACWSRALLIFAMIFWMLTFFRYLLD